VPEYDVLARVEPKVLVIFSTTNNAVSIWFGNRFLEGTQACTATCSGDLVTAHFETLVRSGSKMEMELGKDSLTRKERRL
jgi:hypothetical protein